MGSLFQHSGEAFLIVYVGTRRTDDRPEEKLKHDFVAAPHYAEARLSGLGLEVGGVVAELDEEGGLVWVDKLVCLKIGDFGCENVFEGRFLNVSGNI
jgi:hypothetical protein